MNALRKGSWAAVLVAGLLPAAQSVAQAPVRPEPPRSGISYASADLRALQSDDFANPGMLWVGRGAALWREAAGRSGKSCASCHGNAVESMKGVATRYPRADPGAGELVDMEGRINICRVRHQDAEPYARESAELLALTAYVAHQSRGEKLGVAIEPGSRERFERGRALYFRRIGQMNLACAHCHDRHAGGKLGAETISQGQPNAYPAYRLEWQSLGSLQRRIRACFYGVRAEMPPYGAPELLDLELYLAWRGNGLPVETPGVRR